MISLHLLQFSILIAAIDVPGNILCSRHLPPVKQTLTANASLCSRFIDVFVGHLAKERNALQLFFTELDLTLMILMMRMLHR